MSKKRATTRPSPTSGTEITVGPLAILGGLVVVILLVAGLWWLVAGRAPAVPTTPPPAPTAGLSSFLTAEGDPGLGAQSAPVTIVVYSDFQCPNCRQFATEVVPWLKAGWMARGFVQLVFRDFAVRGPESSQAAEAAHCAAEQGRFWSYHDRLFAAQSGENKGTFSVDNLKKLAAEEGLDAADFGSCLDGGRYRNKVEKSNDEAKAQGFTGTPTFLINGRKTQGAIPVADWEELFQLFAQDFARATQGATGG